MSKEIEDLRLYLEQRGTPAKLPPVDVQFVILKCVQQDPLLVAAPLPHMA